MQRLRTGTFAASAGLSLLLFGASSRAGTFVIEIADETGKGFNDPTPADPVGGNTAPTRGEQALAAFQKAADIWGKAIDSPVPIRVSAGFAELECTATTGKISSGVPHALAHDTPGATPGVIYPIALANKLAGKDLDPDGPDIDLVFNGAVGTPSCQAGSGFYLGLDGNSLDKRNLVTAVLHEIAHGLGMTTFVDLETGELARSPGADGGLGEPMPDIFSTLLIDERTGKHWPDMTDAERADSAKAFQQLAWDGPNVTKAATTLITRGMPSLSFASPLDKLAPAIALAPFGPTLTPTTPAIKGPITAVDDGMGSPQDGCEPPKPITGKIAFVEGGGCSDVQKVLSVQGAGAVAAILVNDQTGQVPLLPTGTDDMKKVTIPSLRVTQQDAGKIRQALAAAPEATIRIDTNRGLGTSLAGRVYLDAPDPVDVGVSVTHWDPAIQPHMLMQPTIDSSVSLDLTVPLMRDLGWRPARCGDGVTEGAEECDNGPTGAGTCSADCKLLDGGVTTGDAGDASADATVRDAGYTPPPGPNRYLDAAGIPAPGPSGIPWVPKHGGCSCRIDGAQTPSPPLGVSGAAIVAGMFLRRRLAKKTQRSAR
jgi:hypothetical protein